MTEQPKNVDFHDTSFLQGHNATYVEQLHGQWARDPAAVDAAWDRYFAALGEDAPSFTRFLATLDAGDGAADAMPAPRC